jgi:hypothetical protein
MVDRGSRDACAQLLRRLMEGTLKGEEFELAVDRLGSSDPAIRAIKTQAWTYYSDWSPVERSVARDARPEIARSILFLQSDAEYPWPPYPSGDHPIYNWLVNVCTLGRWEQRKADRLREWQQHGDHSVWPFHSQGDYHAACAHPRFLVGSS